MRTAIARERPLPAACMAVVVAATGLLMALPLSGARAQPNDADPPVGVAAYDSGTVVLSDEHGACPRPLITNGHRPISFSPDGQHLLTAVSDTIGIVNLVTGDLILYEVEARDTNDVGLLVGPDAWSDDSGRVAIKAGPDLVIVPSDGTPATVTPLSGAYASGAPGWAGDTLVVGTIVNGSSGSEFELWSLPADGTEASVVYEDTGHLINEVIGTADGTVIMQNSIRAQLSIGHLDGSTPVARFSGQVFGMALSPNEELLAFAASDQSETAALYLLGLTSPTPGRLVEEVWAGYDSTTPSWVGDRIAVRLPSPSFDVTLLDPDSGERFRVHAPAEDPSLAVGALHPDVSVGCRIDAGRITDTHHEYAHDAAIQFSVETWPDDQAEHVVLARQDDFADALAGSVLLGDGPLLYPQTNTGLDGFVRAEIDRVLGGDGLVYLLGGPAALSDDIDLDLRSAGYQTRRLAGPSRIETAIAVAQEAVGTGPAADVAVARAYGTPDNPTAAWADSIAAGGWAAATGTPIVITPSDTLHPALADFLDRHAVERTLVLGGSAAISETVVDQLPDPHRLAGTNRAGTAVSIADGLLGPVSAAVVFDGYANEGWAYGLAAASFAASTNAAMILTNHDTLPPASQAWLGRCDAPDLFVWAANGPFASTVDGPVISDSLLTTIAGVRQGC